MRTKSKAMKGDTILLVSTVGVCTMFVLTEEMKDTVMLDKSFHNLQKSAARIFKVDGFHPAAAMSILSSPPEGISWL